MANYATKSVLLVDRHHWGVDRRNPLLQSSFSMSAAILSALESSATMLPPGRDPLRRRKPRDLPLREAVALGQRVAIARAMHVPWRDIAEAEEMAERTLRHFMSRWRADLEREQEPNAVLTQLCRMRVDELAAQVERLKRSNDARQHRQARQHTRTQPSRG